MVYQKHICLLVTEDDKDIIGFDDSVGASIKERFKSVCGDALRFSTYEVVRGQFPTVIDEFDGYLVTGSHYCTHQELPWMLDLEEFIRQVNQIPKIRLFGICFAHQLIAKAFGGKVGRNPCDRYLLGSERLTLSDELLKQRYFTEPFNDKKEIYIMQSHFDQVLEKPTNCTNFGRSEDCENEILAYGDNILTMQGHPEISVTRMDNITIPYFKKKGLISDTQSRIARKGLANSNGDELIGLVGKFLQGM